MKPVDFSQYAKRRIALLYTYLGWDYGGLVVDPNAEQTIEYALLTALEKTRLVEDRANCGLQRCGRTDKGVSAFRQVGSVVVRSAVRSGLGVFDVPADSERPADEGKTEYNFAQILNGVLPTDIRVLAWAAVAESFNARFDCTRRHYKYWLPRAQLDLAAMREAAAALQGEHDFRNFCRIDQSKPDAPTVRLISSCTILDPRDGDAAGTSSAFDMCVLSVVGSGFLRNQIRLIASVLLSVGRGDEMPQVVRELLDVHRCPRRPGYKHASEVPLCLYDAEYANSADLEWQYDQANLNRITTTLQRTWARLQAKASMVQSMVSELQKMTDCRLTGNEFMDVEWRAKRKPQPLLSLPRCKGVDELREKVAAKRRRLQGDEARAAESSV